MTRYADGREYTPRATRIDPEDAPVSPAQLRRQLKAAQDELRVLRFELTRKNQAIKELTAELEFARSAVAALRETAVSA